MVITKIDKTSFKTDEVGTPTYALPVDITNWQLQQIELYLMKLTKDLDVAGKVLINSVTAFISSKMLDKEETRSEWWSYLGRFIQGIKQLEGDTTEPVGYFGVLFGSFSAIFKFLGTDGMTTIAAILYLKQGETSIRKADEFAARIDMFLDVPSVYLYEGLVSFFGEKIKSLKNMASLLQTSETKTNEQPIQTSEPSLPQDSTIDLPIHSETESSNE